MLLKATTRTTPQENIPEYIILHVGTIILTVSIPKSRSVVLTLQSVDEILWCDHSNETSSAVRLHGTIWFFNILQNGI